MMISSFDRVENIVGKGGNSGKLEFSLFPAMFSKGNLLRVVKSQDYLVKG